MGGGGGEAKALGGGGGGGGEEEDWGRKRNVWILGGFSGVEVLRDGERESWRVFVKNN